MKRVSIQILCALLLIPSARGTTRTCADLSQAELNDAINGITSSGHTTWNTPLVDGDTVILPSGDVTWTVPVQFTQGINIEGQTVVNNDGTLADNTIIRNNVGTSQNAAIFLPDFNNPTKPLRLTGVTFRGGTIRNTSSGATVYMVGVFNPDPTTTPGGIRIDHCHFDSLKPASDIEVPGWIYGVIDHCVFDETEPGKNSVFSRPAGWGGGQSGWESWAEGPNFGTYKFLFIENCFFINRTTATNTGTLDSQRGGRWVGRYNVFINCNEFYHGSDSGAGRLNYRGTRAVELYNNTFLTNIQISGGYTRGGSLLWYNNAYYYNCYPPGFVYPGPTPVPGPNGGTNGGMSLKLYRMSQGTNVPSPGQWTVANGQSAWDKNVTESDGVTHIDGHPPYLFLTGTAAGDITIAGETVTFAVATANPPLPLTVNAWSGYSVTNTQRGTYKGRASYIISNTLNTITCVLGAVHNTALRFAVNDSFSIYKVLNVLDSPGMGKDGTPLTGSPPIAGPPVPLNQAVEGCFAWGNTQVIGTGSPIVTCPGSPTSIGWQHTDTNDPLRLGVNFFNRQPQPGDLIYDSYGAYTPYQYPHPLVSRL
jgi:hypothetical protein